MAKNPTPDDIVSTEAAAALLMLSLPTFVDLSKMGWFKAVSPDRWRLVDVVQGYIKSLQHEATRGRSQGEAAAHINMGMRRFQELLDENVIPRQKTRNYNLDDVRQVYIRHLRVGAAGHGISGGAALAKERAALAHEQTMTAQIKNAAARGDLVSLAAVRERYEASLMVFRERALSHPGKMADPLSMRTREEIEPLLRAEMYEMLDELSDPTAYVADKVKRLAP